MLVVVRHGQSEANAIGLLVGRTDSPLSELGQLQAAAIAGALASRGTSTARILTSPLQRAASTAEAIVAAYARVVGPGRAPRVDLDERFVELDYGELDGTLPSDLPPALWEHWRTEVAWRPPGGETIEEVRARVGADCEELSAEAARADVVVVTHLSPVRAAVTWALGGGPEMSWRLSLGVASITRISTGDPLGPVLVGFNDRAHLSGLG